MFHIHTKQQLKIASLHINLLSS